MPHSTTNPYLIIGIDPGSNGGMCMKTSIGGMGEHLVCKIPQTISGVRNVLDTWINEFFSEARAIFNRGVDIRIVVYLESTNQIPFRPKVGKGNTACGMGLGSLYKIAKATGRLEGLLVGMGVNHVLVAPQKWMRALNCMTGGDKRVTRNLAIKMYPHLKPTHATSDAILICHYGEQNETNPERVTRNIRKPKVRRSRRIKANA